MEPAIHIEQAKSLRNSKRIRFSTKSNPTKQVQKLSRLNQFGVFNKIINNPVVRSQLNGNNGEVTGSDDVKNSGMKGLQREIKNILKNEKIILKKINKNPAKKTKKKPGTKKVGKSAKKGINHPLVANAVAQLGCTNISAGSASGLTDPRPSQKFSARNLTVITIPANQDMIAFYCPSCANDTSKPSMIYSTGTPATFALATSSFTSTTAAAVPLAVAQVAAVTNTPYTADQLTDKSLNTRFVAANIKFRFSGTKLNQSGILRHYHDSRHQLMNFNETTTSNFGTVISRMSSHIGTIRFNFTDKPSCDIQIGGHSEEQGQWKAHHTPTAEDWRDTRMGGTTSPYTMGQPMEYIHLSNSSGSAVSFEVEITEHWEVEGETIEILHTPSTSHPILANTISNIYSQAKLLHAKKPDSLFSSMVKQVTKLEHNKAAMMGIEDVAEGALVCL